MLRPIVLAVVLLFAAGPSVSLFCKAWCDPRTAAENGCHHGQNGAAASVTSDDSCDDSFQGPAGLLREDLRRAPTPGASAVVHMTRFQLTANDVRHVAAWTRDRPPSDLKRPQTTPLRL